MRSMDRWLAERGRMVGLRWTDSRHFMDTCLSSMWTDGVWISLEPWTDTYPNLSRQEETWTDTYPGPTINAALGTG